MLLFSKARICDVQRRPDGSVAHTVSMPFPPETLVSTLLFLSSSVQVSPVPCYLSFVITRKVLWLASQSAKPSNKVCSGLCCYEITRVICRSDLLYAVCMSVFWPVSLCFLCVSDLLQGDMTLDSAKYTCVAVCTSDGYVCFPSMQVFDSATYTCVAVCTSNCYVCFPSMQVLGTGGGGCGLEFRVLGY